MQIVNDVARRGFVIGWDPLKLGNALSCVASLFLLSRRTGVPTIYPYADRYSDLFANGTLGWIHVPLGVNKEALKRLAVELRPITETLPDLITIKGSSFESLGEAEVRGIVWFSKLEASLGDWRTGHAERQLRMFCRRGNGLVLQGSYWRQYMDMRELAREGEALRAHLGPLRGDLLPKRRAQMSECAATLKIGLHLRLGDYRIWMDGRFYFSLEAYRSVAERLHRELGDRPHVFHILSDQGIEANVFTGLPIEPVGGIDAYDDFLRLSLCDLVVGPPSTFSTWAAFLGRAKRIVLTKERIENDEALLPMAIDLPFPTGSYVPGDARGAPI